MQADELVLQHNDRGCSSILPLPEAGTDRKQKSMSISDG